MKARIVDNLKDTIESCFDRLGDKEVYSETDFLELCDRIQGKVVDLVFTSGDAFEAIDNNWWLPEKCWTEINDNPLRQEGA